MSEKELYNQLEEYDKYIIKLAKENKKLKRNITKAIEYIEEHKRNVYDTFGEGIVFGEMGGIKEIIKLLKGEKND